MSTSTPKDVPATLTMAQVLLQQGDVWRAEKIYQELLARDPSNLQVRAGLEQCRARKGRREENMREKRRAVLELLLARLTGQPARPMARGQAAAKAAAVVETPAMPAEAPVPEDPRQRRLRVLQTLLEKVRAWKLEAAR